jgi:hypothetical protein
MVIRTSETALQSTRETAYEFTMFGESVREIQNVSKHICKVLSRLTAMKTSGRVTEFTYKRGFDKFALADGRGRDIEGGTLIAV